MVWECLAYSIKWRAADWHSVVSVLMSYFSVILLQGPLKAFFVSITSYVSNAAMKHVMACGDRFIVSPEFVYV